MIRRVSVIGTVSFMVISASLWAFDDPKDKTGQDKPKTPAEEFRELSQEFTKLQGDYIRALQAAKTNEDRQEAFKKAPKGQEFAPRFLAIADNNPKDAVAVDALLWVVQNGTGSPAQNKAIDGLIENHLASAKIQNAFARTQLTPAMDKLARAVIEKSPHLAAKRQACIALAVTLKGRRQADEAEKFFQRIVDEFADLDSLMQVVQSNASGPSGSKAIEILIKDHVASPNFGQALQRVSASRQPTPGIEKLYLAVIEKSDNRDAKGNATFGLAQFLKGQADMAQGLKGADEARVKQYEAFYGADMVKKLQGMDIESTSNEVEKLLAKIVQDFADVKGPRGTLGAAAEPDLFEIRHLSVGKEVPEIDEEDVDGVKFKLSDYRGKVVLIDFWGHW